MDNDYYKVVISDKVKNRYRKIDIVKNALELNQLCFRFIRAKGDLNSVYNCSGDWTASADEIIKPFVRLNFRNFEQTPQLHDEISLKSHTVTLIKNLIYYDSLPVESNNFKNMQSLFCRCQISLDNFGDKEVIKDSLGYLDI